MSAKQNIEMARQMYEAFGRGDVPAILGPGIAGAGRRISLESRKHSG